MLKRRFSTTLLALVVAVAIPGSAFAADVASESTGEVSVPASVSAPESSTNEVDSSGSTDADTNGSSDADTNGSVETDNSGSADVGDPAGESESPADSIDDNQQQGDSDQNVDVVLPKEDDENGQSPDVIEPDPEDEDGTGVVEEPTDEEQPAEEVIQPETPIAEPEVVPEEIILPGEEVVVTEAAIVVPEVVTEAAIITTEAAIVAQPATLSIVQQLTVGNDVFEYLQKIEDLVIGTEIDLTPYIKQEEGIKLVGEPPKVVVSEQEQTVTLKYEYIPELNLGDKDVPVTTSADEDVPNTDSKNAESGI